MQTTLSKDIEVLIRSPFLNNPVRKMAKGLIELVLPEYTPGYSGFEGQDQELFCAFFSIFLIISNIFTLCSAQIGFYLK